MAVSRVGDPNHCTIAMKPGKELPENSTRNVVFKEVLVGCVDVVDPSDPAPAAVQSPPVVVGDLDDDWPDYDGIEDLLENGEFEEEFEVSSQRPVQKPAAKQSRRSRPVSRRAGPLPPLGPDEVLLPLPEFERSEYELIREDNIRECREKWFESFGVEYPAVE